MSEQIESLTLRQYRDIRERVDRVAEDVENLKHRMTGVETTLGHVRRDIAEQTATMEHHYASLMARFDRNDKVQDRILARLELIDSPAP